MKVKTPVIVAMTRYNYVALKHELLFAKLY